MEDLETAIQQFQEALDTTPENHLDLAGRFNSLGVGYRDRYQRTGAIEDLEMAIQQSQKAVDATPKKHSVRAGRLESLGIGYRNRYQRIGAIEDLEIAIQQFEEALDETPENHPARAGRLESLGIGYQDRYHRIGAMEDLEIAIQRFQEALDTTPENQSIRAARFQTLGIVYNDRYQRTGAIEDLEIAIQQSQKALDATPENHPARAGRLESLGIGYRDRYHKTGAMEDLETAIQRFQEALDATPENHLDLAGRLESLGIGYQDKYQRTGAIEDLETAIQQSQKAFDATPDNHPARAGRLTSLGIGYSDRYRRIGAVKDLDTTIQRYQEALDATPENHSARANLLAFLGTGYSDRYQRTEAIEDLEITIQRFQEAVDATPQNHPAQADRLQSLGVGYRNKYQRTGAIKDLETAIQHFTKSIDQISSPVRARLRSSKILLELYAVGTSWSSAYQVASKSLLLIPLLTPRSLQNSDKQHLLADIVGMASDGAAIALNLGRDPFDALKFLEQGRGVLATSLQEIRTETLDLEKQHLELAKEFNSLRQQLDSPIANLVYERHAPSGQDQTSKRNDVSKRLNEVIEEIRQQDGFRDFLLPPSKEEMVAAARLGSIVVINVSKYRCDAILVEKHQIRLLHLPDLSKKEIEEKSVEILGTPKVLEWLWDVAVHPILEALGFIQPPSDGNWPHVWWITTGPLSKFPLHAAGYHSKPSMESTLDRVMSSYSSSIKTIIHARRRSVVNNMLHTPAHALLVAMKVTPGCSSLLFAEEEIVALKTLCKSMNLIPLKAKAQMESVKSHLPKCKIFHFAGHGHTNLTDPSRSSLLLEDGRLTVATLLEMNLRESSPFLAYLSACGTGQIGDEKFFDESIHLISAYQLAGFRHVIGTLWEVNDESCVDMTNITYGVIQDRGITDESICRGLHEAVRKLRTCWLDGSSEKRRVRKRRQLEKDKASLECNQGTRNVSSKERDTRLPRSVLEDDSDEGEDEKSRGPLHWVPYVHFGV
ncbi:hypothetical protein BofuT4_P085660.1 [Botrytis cinerea T4]|uniref:CHAT domain-containing protein n=1 Tax=Botryotinia fuckeliana (strain T4) TaxID=999810 RepID=G2YHL7_BOTF4|nr:hypothetical protein BofuT4_P085660.1 [Botrytis cinerea T4]